MALKSFLTVLLVLYSFPALAEGRVTDLHEVYFLKNNGGVRVESTFFIELTEPGSLKVGFNGCEVDEGRQDLIFFTLKKEIKVNKFLLNDVPVQPVQFHLENPPPKKYRCSAQGDREGMSRTELPNPEKIYPPGIYKFEIETFSKWLASVKDGNEMFGSFVAVWVRDNYIIEKATAEIVLPPDYIIEEAWSVSATPSPKAVKNVENPRELFFSTSQEKIFESHYKFTATTELKPGIHEFTVGATYKQPIIKNDWLFRDLSNRFGVGTTTILNFLLAVIVLAYFLLSWLVLLVSSRPRHKRYYFEAPFGFGPAHLENIEVGKYDIRAFTATLLDLAIKGALKICYRKGVFTLKRTGKMKTLTQVEESIQGSLFHNHGEEVVVGGGFGDGAKTLNRAFSEFSKTLLRESKLIRNKLGVWLLVFGIVLSLTAISFALFMTPWRGPNYYLLFAGYSFVAAFYGFRIFSQRNIFSRRRVFSQIFFWVATGAFLFWSYFGEQFYSGGQGLGPDQDFWEMLPLVFIWFLNLVFIVTIGKTFTSREITDQVTGYKDYLRETDPQILMEKIPFREDIKIFLKHLPYVVALGFEKNWGYRFDTLFRDGKLTFQKDQATWDWLEIYSKKGETLSFEDIATLLGKTLALEIKKIL